jgi:HTH-type transcriptional regulator/antitoxin HigA
MVKSDQNEYFPDHVSPPGETLQELLDQIGMTQAELAERTGRPRKTINEIIKGTAAITPDTALQLERVLGVPATFWNNRENHYRQCIARQAERDRLKRDIEWLGHFPIRGMVRLGWIGDTRDKVTMLRNVLSFFGVASPAAWRDLWREVPVAYRKSPSLKSRDGALTAWLRRGELMAQWIECQPYDSGKFKQILNTIRGLTVEDPSVFVPELQDMCADCGVAVVFVPELPGTHAWGATRWLTASKAMMQLSLRYKTDDHLWFSFFHESCHILKHSKRMLYVERSEGCGKEEEEANRFAADILIPPLEYRRFAESGIFTKLKIIDFADKLGISPGIVVGRLQHDKLLPQTHCNDLKRRFEWIVEEKVVTGM